MSWLLSPRIGHVWSGLGPGVSVRPWLCLALCPLSLGYRGLSLPRPARYLALTVPRHWFSGSGPASVPVSGLGSGSGPGTWSRYGQGTGRDGTRRWERVGFGTGRGWGRARDMGYRAGAGARAGHDGTGRGLGTGARGTGRGRGKGLEPARAGSGTRTGKGLAEPGRPGKEDEEGPAA